MSESAPRVAHQVRLRPATPDSTAKAAALDAIDRQIRDVQARIARVEFRRDTAPAEALWLEGPEIERVLNALAAELVPLRERRVRVLADIPEPTITRPKSPPARATGPNVRAHVDRSAVATRTMLMATLAGMEGYSTLAAAITEAEAAGKAEGAQTSASGELGGVLGAAVLFLQKWTTERASGLEQRIGALEAKAETALSDGGVWTGDKDFAAGALVNHKGGVWIARTASRGIEPGANDTWRLTVRRPPKPKLPNKGWPND
jgi:hypothetical protein